MWVVGCTRGAKRRFEVTVVGVVGMVEKTGWSGRYKRVPKGLALSCRELIIPGSSQCPYLLLSSHSQLYAYLANPRQSLNINDLLESWKFELCWQKRIYVYAFTCKNIFQQTFLSVRFISSRKLLLFLLFD